jgi:hypothetical protein
MHIEEFDEIDYQLIAIHTSLEDYRLAYYINQSLPIVLRKCENNIQIKSKEGETQFSRFIFEDEKAVMSWNLIQNKNDILLSQQTNNQGLFSDSNTNFSSKAYLIPEYKKVDFFIKIENTSETFAVSKITSTLKKIARISTVYTVEVEKIKSKNNLIF